MNEATKKTQKGIRDGIALLSKRRLENLQQNINEQHKLRDMLEKYHPWGRPGGGAPTENYRLHNIRRSELFPDDEKRYRCQLYRNLTPRTRVFNPNATIKEDPSLRFQLGDTVRPEIENKIRYRTTKQQQDFYRRQLDAIVADQKKAREAMEKENKQYHKLLERYGNPWGKSGPGGFPWRPPPKVGSNFFKSMGWTTENALLEIDKTYDKRKLPKMVEPPKLPEDEQRKSTSELTGGVELVPLFAKRRGESIRLPLSTTDVTNLDKLSTHIVPDYLEQLSVQVKQKHQKILEAQQKEVDSSKEHFAKWQGYWGRPGHGAPGQNTYRHSLNDILFYNKPLKCQNN